MSNLGNNRFVILYHELPEDSLETAQRSSHWDLMLADGHQLLTWALETQPERGEKIFATRLPDHRLAYLDYEGPISGNRGRVERFATGTFAWVVRSQQHLVLDVDCDKWFRRIEIEFVGRDGSPNFVCTFS